MPMIDHYPDLRKIITRKARSEMLPEVKKAFRDPFKRLARKGENPQVRFVAQAASDSPHRREAEEILKALPMTLPELDAFGRERGWNGDSTWVAFYEEAVASRVFGAEAPAQAQEPSVAERANLSRESWIDRHVPASHRSLAREVMNRGSAEQVRAALRERGFDTGVALDLVRRAEQDGVLS